MRSEGKFQENKDWNTYQALVMQEIPRLSEGKFQENKDWNSSSSSSALSFSFLWGQVPRKQGLKLCQG